MANRYFPGTWDWAAASLGMDAPDPLLSAHSQSPMQRRGKPTAGRKPPPHSFAKSTGRAAHCGAPPTPYPIENATWASTHQPHPAPTMDVGEGHGKSQPAVKAPSSFLVDGSYPLKPKNSSPGAEKGAVALNATKGGICTPTDKGFLPSFPAADIGMLK